ncbi:MAG TPA: efflux RND transporter periplasmic adaptor subunit [Vicinamibacterales bacterium]|nr:efflux RND transporter periplasmic adaptor subunit [Vicinamibacterales bacterium]
MNRSVVIIPVLILGVAVVAAGCQSPEATAQTAAAEPAAATVDVPVVTASMGAIEAALEISGTLAPRTRVAVKPRLPGTLEAVLVEIGDAVTTGQVIARIDRREIDAQADAAAAAVAVAKAGLETADASLANAALESDRAKVLFEGGALPRQRLDAAQTAHRAGLAQRDLAAANLAQAEASLRRAREVQRDTTITSPLTGFVVERNYDAGAMPGDPPVVVVADMRQMKLEAGVSELEAGRLRVGMKARIEAQAKPGQVFEGELAAIAPEVDERNRHFRIEVRVPNQQRDLLSGMYATARIVASSQANALLLPREAIGTREGKRVVLRVQNGTVTPVEVTEGLNDGARVQIVKGLAAGDTVVADARRQVAPGARVRPVPTH